MNSTSRIDAISSRSYDRPSSRILVLLGFSAFAIAQPFLSLLGGNVELFAYHNFVGWGAIAFVATATAKAGEQPSVVVLLLDELPTQSVLTRTGNINAEGFPHLAALAGEATWYPNYTVAATLTNKAVPGLLTSSMDISKRGLFTNYPNNLMTLMAKTHQSHVFETFTRLCQLKDCEGLAGDAGSVSKPESDTTLYEFSRASLDLFASRMSFAEHAGDKADFAEKPANISSADSNEPLTAPIFKDLKGIEAARSLRLSSGEPLRFRKFLSTFEKDQPPSLHLLHLLLPHQPWRYYASGGFYSTPLFGNVQDSYPFSRNNNEPWLSVLSEYRHLLQSFYTDKLVGSMVERLKEIGLWESSLVIVVADHGISFEQNTPIRTIQDETLDALAYVPLLVKYPGQKASKVNRANVSAMDILPTIAAATNIELPFNVEGLSLLEAAVTQRDDVKTIIDVEDRKGQPIRGVLEFSMQATQPKADSRWLGDLQNGNQPITLLNDWLGITALAGRRFEDIVDREGGTASIRDQHALESVGDPAPAMVVGTVRDANSRGGTVLLVVDGVVATGSPIIEFDGIPSAYVAFIPQQWAGASRILSLGLRTKEGEVLSLKLK